MKRILAMNWRRIAAAAIMVILSLDVRWTRAHEGEPHGTPAPVSGTIGGPVTLTDEGRRNLGIEVAPVETRTLVSGPTGFGTVEPLPGRVYVVSARISGRVTKALKLPGDRVRAGEPVLEIESRVVADPPVRITLPSRIAGVVIERTVEVGQPVEPEQSLLTIADLSRVLFRVDVYEVDFGGIAPGLPVEIRLESYPGRVFRGNVARLGQVADPAARTIPVWVEIPNDDGHLRLNMRGSARIVTRETGPVTVVPRPALLGDAANRFVYRDNGDAFVPTPIVTGAEDESWIEVKSGLIPGDQVAVTGNYELQYVTSTEPAAAASDTSKPVAPPAGRRKWFGC